MPTSAIITSANGSAIKDAFGRIAFSHLPNQRWLGVKNYYKSNTKRRVDTETLPTLIKRKRQMEEYIAASVIVHSSDGWVYLSRAVESLINGDISSSIHFAYYAELRSAMSLMAFEGIGIFNNVHVWFNSHKVPALKNGPGTHVAVDNCFKEWAKLSTKKEVIFNFLKVNNQKAADWIRETGFSTRAAYSSSIVNKWLQKWSVDLHLDEDRRLRNEMSYRPHFETSQVDINEAVNKLTSIWNVLEPTAANRFPSLDRYLLRFSLEEIYRKIKYSEPVGADFANFITNIFNRLGEDTTQVLFNFLVRAVEPDDHLIFTEATKDRLSVDVNREDPFPIICRAILLLRLSTGAANSLIVESGLDINNLRFWWEKLSLEQGCISIRPSGIDTIDLYTDIRESIDEINILPAGAMNNIRNTFNDISEPLFYLKQFQRIGFWGMGL